MKERLLGLPFVITLLAAAAACELPLVVGVTPGTGGSGGTTTTTTTAPAPAHDKPDPTISAIRGPRPGMVGVTSPGNVTFYVDATEVTQAAYAVFLASQPQLDPRSASCWWKTTFAPGMESKDYQYDAGDAATEPSPTQCRPGNTLFDPVGHGNDPVVCVDWCDAQAYCLWAGKRLCGHIGGGPSSHDDFADADAGQWYAACSNGGTTTFPYGDAYVPGTCNDGPSIAAVGQSAGCRGSAPPGDTIFDMSGNVHEWDDFCMADPDYTEGGVREGHICRLRGGGFLAYGPAPQDPPPAGTFFMCGMNIGTEKYGGTWSGRNREDQTIGFRCCGD